ncbi:MAG: AAA-like domain-containing protein, partial [Prevotellaceae bacterium]|nr:AAA-like domain-containing protein [Prevotellaceae bacterium]
MTPTTLPSKIFNTAGPIKPEIHYCVNPLTRFNLAELESLITYGKYFILHAPRQTGKTSCMLALRDYLNRQGRYYAVSVNVENGQAYRNNVEEVTRIAVSNLCDKLGLIIGKELPNRVREETIAQVPIGSLLSGYLSRLSQALDRPLIIFFDEIDALVGDSLVSILRQIRSGYEDRPAAFPQSVVLCGVRDVRDYRIVQSNQEIITGGSAFNIKAKSLRLGNFSKEEIHELYMQHTQATGQVFDEACFPMVWEATEGQPWLVNALAYEVTEEMTESCDRSVRITPEMLYRAKENIIYRRETHIDILIDKLREDRVRNVIAPILANEEGEVEEQLKEDDIQYVVDLGLIVRSKPLR